MTTITSKTTCDLCGREIKPHAYIPLFCDTYIIKGFFRDKHKADICDDCRRIIITKRIEAVDADELEKTMEHIDSIIEKWEREEPGRYQDFAAGDVLPLMFPAGTMRNSSWGKKRGFPTPTSMRNVDASCEAMVLENGYSKEEN